MRVLLRRRLNELEAKRTEATKAAEAKVMAALGSKRRLLVAIEELRTAAWFQGQTYQLSHLWTTGEISDSAMANEVLSYDERHAKVGDVVADEIARGAAPALATSQTVRELVGVECETFKDGIAHDDGREAELDHDMRRRGF